MQLGVSQVSEECLGKGAIANMGFESDPLEKFLKFHVKINALWSDWQTVKSYGFDYYCTEMQSAKVPVISAVQLRLGHQQDICPIDKLSSLWTALDNLVSPSTAKLAY